MWFGFNTHKFGERISGPLLATSRVTSIRLVIAASLTLRENNNNRNLVWVKKTLDFDKKQNKTKPALNIYI